MRVKPWGNIEMCEELDLTWSQESICHGSTGVMVVSEQACCTSVGLFHCVVYTSKERVVCEAQNLLCCGIVTLLDFEFNLYFGLRVDLNLNSRKGVLVASFNIFLFGCFQEFAISKNIQLGDEKGLKFPSVWDWSLQLTPRDRLLFHNPLYIGKSTPCVCNGTVKTFKRSKVRLG